MFLNYVILQLLPITVNLLHEINKFESRGNVLYCSISAYQNQLLGNNDSTEIIIVC